MLIEEKPQPRNWPYEEAEIEKIDMPTNIDVPAEGSLRCPQCRTRNPAERRYCTKCGKNLWEACLRCGTLGLAEEKYCGTCGADVAGDIHERSVQFEAELQLATKLMDEGRFDEAIAVLDPVSQASHLRLAECARRAAELIKECAAQRNRSQTESETAHREAQQLVAAGDYERAMRLLDGIATQQTTDEMRRLREEVGARMAEIETLATAVHAASRTGLSLTTLAAVTRLLELQPGHAAAWELAERLRAALCNMARKLLLQHKYEEAMKFLDRVPPVVRSGDFAALRDQAAERAWLARDLRAAPVVDKPLVALTQHLLDLEPGDPQATKLLDELKRRAGAGGKDAKQMVLPWAAPPKKPKLGCRVDWLTGFQRIGFGADFDGALPAEQPGRFFVAAGLALQGLSEAAVDVNLLPEDGGGMLRRVAKFMVKRGSRSAWGIDLGTSGVKALELALNPADQAVEIIASDLIEYAKPLHHASTDDEARALVEAALRTFVARNNLKGSRICVGLPAGMLLMRQMKVPRTDEEKLARVVAHGARGLFPLPIGELVWTYVPLDERSEDALHVTRECDVLALAAKRFQLKDRLARWQALGLTVDVVQSDCTALWNFLAYEYFADDDEDGGEGIAAAATARPIAMLDIGSTTTNFIVASPDLAWLRSTGLAADQFNKALVCELQLTLLQAEELKRNPASARNVAQLYDSLEPVFEQFSQELERWLAELAKIHWHWRVDRILGVGGGFLMHGLLRHLRERA